MTTSGGTRWQDVEHQRARPTSRTVPLRPSNVEELRRLVTAHLGHYPRRIAQAAEYVLDHPELVAFGTVATIAAGAGVVPSTLSRFGQLLGFDGFAGLQELFRNDLFVQVSNERQANTRETVHMRRLRDAIDRQKAAFDTLRSAIDAPSLDAFLGITVPAETIYIIAKGRSFPAAIALTHMLSRQGVRTQLATRSESATDDILASARPSDALIEIDIWGSEAQGFQGSILARVLQANHRSMDARLPPESCFLRIPSGNFAEIAAISLCRILSEFIGEGRSKAQ